MAWFRRRWLAENGRAPIWVQRDFSARVPKVKARVQMITGGYDLFTPWQLEDFAALQHADRARQLIIGPWTHTAEGLAAAGVRHGLPRLRRDLLGDPRLVDPATVRVFVTGERTGDGWRRQFAQWPPEETAERRLWIVGDDQLGWEPPAPGTGGSRRYRYDPADPTPSLGGPVMVIAKPVVDNRRLEARSDAATSTTVARGSIRSDGPRARGTWCAPVSHTSICLRVYVMSPHAASRGNVCDALASVAPGRFERSDDDGAWLVRFDLWPIAHRFAAGNRISPADLVRRAPPRTAPKTGYGRGSGRGRDPAASGGGAPLWSRAAVAARAPDRGRRSASSRPPSPRPASGPARDEAADPSLACGHAGQCASAGVVPRARAGAAADSWCGAGGTPDVAHRERGSVGGEVRGLSATGRLVDTNPPALPLSATGCVVQSGSEIVPV